MRLYKLAIVAVLTLAASAFAQSPEDAAGDTRVLVIYDSSNSMWGELADKSRK